MDINNIHISRKYATAFLNLFFYKIDQKSFLNIIDAFNYLKFNNNIFYILSLSNLSLSKRKEIVNLLLTKFDLPLEFTKLTDLLFNAKRIFLLIDILREIILIYENMASIIIFDISSAKALNDSDLHIIRNFLEKKSGKKIIESYKIDKSLIAGIKAKSKTYLWEYSIDKRLRNLTKLIV